MRAEQLDIARSWILLFTLAATVGLWWVFYNQLKLFYLSGFLGFVVAFVMRRILSSYVTTHLAEKYDHGDPTVSVTLSDELVPADRLTIYRNTSRSALTNALRLNFPAVQRLVGEDFFTAAADTFITREPPQTARLDLYGQGFPEFLQSFEPAAALI